MDHLVRVKTPRDPTADTFGAVVTFPKDPSS